MSKRSILTTTLKALALTGSLALFSVSLLQSCRGSVQEGFPAATNSPTAVPTRQLFSPTRSGSSLRSCSSTFWSLASSFSSDQGDAPHYVGRLIRHILSGGFIYLMILNAFPWMTAVLQSFSRIGATATGLPNLNPQTVLGIGGSMAETLFNSPANASFMPNLELAIVESVSAFFDLLSFVIAAAALMLTLIESYLVDGGAALLLGFAGSRWTASIAEGYFSYVVKVGTRLLFFYLVLGIGVQVATQWQAALTAACNPVATALPWYSTYGLPPKAIMTTVCSNAIPVRTMLDLAAFSIVF